MPEEALQPTKLNIIEEICMTEEEKFNKLIDGYVSCIAFWLLQHKFMSSAEYKKCIANKHIILQLLRCNSAAELHFQYIISAAQFNLTHADFAVMAIASCSKDETTKRQLLNNEMFVELADSKESNALESIFKNPSVAIKLFRYAANGPFVDKTALKKICAHMLKRWPDLKKMNGFYKISRKNNKKIRIPLFSDEDIEQYY